jgi:hypothetical protein
LVFEQGSSDVKGETNFSDKFWGSQSREYASVAKEVLHDESQSFIFHTAKHYSKDMMPYHDEDESATANSQAKPKGRRAMLVDIL